MVIARHYEMQSREGEEEALRSALITLAGKVVPIAGCDGVELMQDVGNPGQFVFIERWTSIEAHKAGGQALGRAVLDGVMSAVAGPPKARSLNYIPL